MPKIHDWSRTEWNSADQAQEKDTDVLCRYENEHGDEVTYEYGGEEGYVIKFNGEPIEDVELDGEQYEELDVGTRKDARELTASWLEEQGSPEQLGHVDEEEDEEPEYEEGELPEEWPELQSLAKEEGVYEQGDSAEELREKLTG